MKKIIINLILLSSLQNNNIKSAASQCTGVQTCSLNNCISEINNATYAINTATASSYSVYNTMLTLAKTPLQFMQAALTSHLPYTLAPGSTSAGVAIGSTVDYSTSFGTKITKINTGKKASFNMWEIFQMLMTTAYANFFSQNTPTPTFGNGNDFLSVWAAVPGSISSTSKVTPKNILGCQIPVPSFDANNNIKPGSLKNILQFTNSASSGSNYPTDGISCDNVSNISIPTNYGILTQPYWLITTTAGTASSISTTYFASSTNPGSASAITSATNLTVPNTTPVATFNIPAANLGNPVTVTKESPKPILCVTTTGTQTPTIFTSTGTSTIPTTTKNSNCSCSMTPNVFNKLNCILNNNGTGTVAAGSQLNWPGGFLFLEDLMYYYNQLSAPNAITLTTTPSPIIWDTQSYSACSASPATANNIPATCTTAGSTSYYNNYVCQGINNPLVSAQENSIKNGACTQKLLNAQTEVFNQNAAINTNNYSFQNVNISSKDDIADLAAIFNLIHKANNITKTAPLTYQQFMTQVVAIPIVQKWLGMIVQNTASLAQIQNVIESNFLNYVAATMISSGVNNASNIGGYVSANIPYFTIPSSIKNNVVGYNSTLTTLGSNGTSLASTNGLPANWNFHNFIQPAYYYSWKLPNTNTPQSFGSIGTTGSTQVAWNYCNYSSSIAQTSCLSSLGGNTNPLVIPLGGAYPWIISQLALSADPNWAALNNSLTQAENTANQPSASGALSNCMNQAQQNLQLGEMIGGELVGLITTGLFIGYMPAREKLAQFKELKEQVKFETGQLETTSTEFKSGVEGQFELTEIKGESDAVAKLRGDYQAAVQELYKNAGEGTKWDEFTSTQAKKFQELRNKVENLKNQLQAAREAEAPSSGQPAANSENGPAPTDAAPSTVKYNLGAKTYKLPSGSRLVNDRLIAENGDVLGLVNQDGKLVNDDGQEFPTEDDELFA